MIERGADMSRYYGYPRYESVAEKMAKVQKRIEKLKKKNPDIAPIVISGRKLAKTWWAKAWNENLESYSDYYNRIGRGRSYVRHGAVADLKIEKGIVTALVQGTRAAPYSVQIVIKPLKKGSWKEMTKACEGRINSLNELTEGKFPKELGDVFTKQKNGLFPCPGEISFSCSCPDWASMCKHVAAVLYGIGARFDEDPTLFFLLRDINMDELVTKAVTEKSESLIKKSKKKTKRVIDDGDISAMFQIDMKDEENQ